MVKYMDRYREDLSSVGRDPDLTCLLVLYVLDAEKGSRAYIRNAERPVRRGSRTCQVYRVLYSSRKTLLGPKRQKKNNGYYNAFFLLYFFFSLLYYYYKKERGGLEGFKARPTLIFNHKVVVLNTSCITLLLVADK